MHFLILLLTSFSCCLSLFGMLLLSSMLAVIAQRYSSVLMDMSEDDGEPEEGTNLNVGAER